MNVFEYIETITGAGSLFENCSEIIEENSAELCVIIGDVSEYTLDIYAEKYDWPEELLKTLRRLHFEWIDAQNMWKNRSDVRNVAETD